MTDWRKKIDFLEEQERLHKEALEYAKGKAEHDANLKKLASFRCHVCGVQSRKPGKSYSMSGDYSMNEWDDWSKPGDMMPCTKCNYLTCDSHIYKGICKKCAEKL